MANNYAPSLDGNKEREGKEQPELQKSEENMMKSESVDAQTLEKKELWCGNTIK